VTFANTLSGAQPREGSPGENWRKDFPLISNVTVNGWPLVYLDNAATTQKPECVIEAEARVYRKINANINRGVHSLSMASTEAYEAARRTVANFLGADTPDEIIFTRGATEGINLVVNSWGRRNLKAGDEIILTQMEHHANIVPWQMLAEEIGCSIRWLVVEPDGSIPVERLEAILTAKTRFVSFVWVSNTLGTVNPVKAWVDTAKAAGAVVLVDAAQAVSHFPVNVSALGADFLVFSGHKLFAPTGIGVLWGNIDRLQAMPPWQGGGDMISRVTQEKTTFKAPPHRFEAGTPNYVGAIALAEAIRYLESLDRAALAAHEADLLTRASEGLQGMDGIRIVGEAPGKISILSFLVDGVHPHDVATFLDQEGIAIRAGHHCTQPLMRHFGLSGTARASFAFYNTVAEVDHFLAAIKKMKQFFKV
jgi:cysteine desulfurase/selenocysteine lyase